MTNHEALMKALSSSQLDRFIEFLNMLTAYNNGEKTEKDFLAFALTLSEEDAKRFTEIMSAA